ncbi:hypothetical protein KCP76_23165 [Salmonella enterica subsp. enterica serovar Weltevreden]|nr:hypothetical protein KCP76_23165 [Salmonella enterica subsp. enterica serovar Weltevreden]
MAYSFPGASVVVDIARDLAANEFERKSGIRKVSEGEKIASVNASRQKIHWARCLPANLFWLTTGLRFGQAGNSGLIQTFFLAGYLVQTLLFYQILSQIDALSISSVIGFITSSQFWGGCPITRSSAVYNIEYLRDYSRSPMLSIVVVDKTHKAPGAYYGGAVIVIHNFLPCWDYLRAGKTP